ncbi:hypothetical protein [Sulfurimonas hydrogeniphila]|uniref:hypothetical protein n=1 Tax=Sulfurimonas hydrogeniphila TaxID=2509341 RepID=UPI00125FEFE3|nr:hypothetical protein [Sulfurimonas hydrogeniphila]
MFDLKAKLEEEFHDVPIVKLKDLTKKIAVISKVRVGTKRDVLDYNEVTLADIDAYGIIQVNSTKKKPAPANASAIASQALHKNDLLVSYRGLDIQVGRIDREYKHPVVSNNSAIRIQFEYEDAQEAEEVSLFVQTYLQLPYVKKYIAKRPQSSENNRKILSPLFLANLPIPLFYSRDYAFKDFIYKRLKAVHTVKKMIQEMEELQIIIEEHKDNSLPLYLSNATNLSELVKEDIKALTSLGIASKRVKNLVKEFVSFKSK